MKALVTGGAGFIGSNLVDQLVKLNHEVVVLDNLSTGDISNLKQVSKKIKFVKIDIFKNKNSIQKYFHNVDQVYHMAGLADMHASILNSEKYFQTNVEGTLNVLGASKKAKVKKFIYAASASCYGSKNNYPTNEKSKIKTENPYALTKFFGEQLVMHWAKIYSMPNVSLRFFNVYGPRSSKKNAYSSVFGIFLSQKFKKKSLTIVGNGNQTRDFIHVYDLVQAMIKASKKAKNGEIYNVGSGKETTINFLADLFGGQKKNIPKRPGEADKSLADIKKIKQHLNWKPEISIKDGVKMLIESKR